MMPANGEETSKSTPPDQSRPATLRRPGGAESLQLVMLGDCMLGRLVDEVLETQPPEYPWGDTLPVLQGADWRMCNLECVVSDRGTPWSAYTKAFHFRSSAKNIAVLKAAKINAVSIANNHTLDYGYDAMFEMLEILDRSEIAHNGAGASLEEASRLAISNVRGTKVGLLAFTDNEPGWEATTHRPGAFYVPVDLKDRRAQNLLEIIRRERNAVDLLIVSAHWGSNWGYAPEKGHVAFAHALIEAGASAIFGHSCHVFRGIEFYKGCPIFYSAGNFVDDYAVDPIERNDEAFIYVLEVRDWIAEAVHLHPTLIRNCQARRAEGVRRMAIVQKMEELCAAFGTSAIWNSDRQWLEIDRSKRRDAEMAGAHS
jgi:poly-gamma-glutamate capsule biosynthesis protein CapA/YwtB (metallophosphatase superfamily)